MEASLGNPFRMERPQRRHGLPRCMAGPHVALLAHKHAVPPLPPLPPLPPAVAALGSLAVPGHDAHNFPRRFHSSQRVGRVGCKKTLAPYNVNMPNTLGNVLPPSQMQPSVSAHADLGSGCSPLGDLGILKPSSLSGLPFKSCTRVKVVNYLSLVFSVRDVKSYHLWS